VVDWCDLMQRLYNYGKFDTIAREHSMCAMVLTSYAFCGMLDT